MGRVQTAILAVLISFGLWCATRVEAMPEQAKIIIEDKSGPWILAAAIFTATIGVAGSAGYIRRRREQPVRRKK